jgi:arylsulfatase
VFIQHGKLVFDYNYFGEHFVVESDSSVPSGGSVVGVKFRRAKKDADVELSINEQVVGTMHLPKFMRMMSSVGASVGYDDGSPVSERYSHEFHFSGYIERVDIDVIPSDREAEQAVNDAEGRSIQARQ